MTRLLYILIWFVISLAAGALLHYFSDVSFWSAALIAALALTVNGFIAEWEDRREDGDS